jgi:hypothetical protein
VGESVVKAVHLYRKLRGSSQAVLARCSDGLYYAIKFTNNPNGICALRNELVTTRLAQALDLPVPNCSLVFVDEWLLTHTPEVAMTTGATRSKYEAGTHLGSATPYDVQRSQAFEAVFSGFTNRITNPREFAGMLVLDLWTGRSAARQLLLVRDPTATAYGAYKAVFIDHKMNLSYEGGTDGVYPFASCRDVYRSIYGWESFEPWLTRIEELDLKVIRWALTCVPDGWGAGEEWRLQVFNHLNEGRAVGSRISQLRTQNPDIFPNWLLS